MCPTPVLSAGGAYARNAAYMEGRRARVESSRLLFLAPAHFAFTPFDTAITWWLLLPRLLPASVRDAVVLLRPPEMRQATMRVRRASRCCAHREIRRLCIYMPAEVAVGVAAVASGFRGHAAFYRIIRAHTLDILSTPCRRAGACGDAVVG